LKGRENNMAYNQSVSSSDFNAAKELYDTTGALSSISNSVKYMSNQGYTSEEIAEVLNTADSEYSISSADIDDLLQQIDNSQEYQNDFSNLSYAKDTIIGLPFRYNYMTDPGRRTYNKTFFDCDIMTIVPGFPKYRGADTEIKNSVGSSFFSSHDDQLDSNSLINNEAFGLGSDPDLDTTVFNWLMKNQKSTDLKANKDLRYYGFSPNMKMFLQYLELALESVGVKMGLIGVNNLASMSNFNSYMNQNFGTSSFKFYVSKNANLSESISNSFSESAIASSAKTISDISKEAMFLLGKNGTDITSTDLNTIWGINSEGGFGKTLSDSISSAKKLINGADSSGVATEIFDDMRAAINGVNMVYPEIWKDSSFSRNFSVSFKFVSPYGTPQAIFEYVYLPFLILFTLAAPRQVGINGVTSPFLCKVDVPGYFTSDLAVITSIDWTKGGDDQLYNKDGLPLAMNVSVTFKDLYPLIMLPRKFQMLRVNQGMHGFLDNMAGLSTERYTPFEDIANSLKIRAGYTLGQVERGFSRSVSDWLYRVSRSITNTANY
jgi:hypothetical protein